MSENVLTMDKPFSSAALNGLDVNRMSIPELADGIRAGNKACMMKMYTLLHDDLFAIARKTIQSARQAEFIVRKTFAEVMYDHENIDPDLFELNLIQVLTENTRKEDIHNTYTSVFRHQAKDSASSLVSSVKARAVPAKLQASVKEESRSASSVNLAQFAAEGVLSSGAALPDYADTAESGAAAQEQENHISRTLSIPVILGSAAAIAAAGIGTSVYQHEQAKKRDLSYTQMMDALQISFDLDESGHEINTFEYQPGASESVSDLVSSHTGTLQTNVDAIDLSSVGSTLVNYTLSASDSYGQTGVSSVRRSYTVRDTQAPVISAAVESVTITEGDSFDPLSVVSQVMDPADGELVRVDAEPAALTDDPSGRMYETGWYTVSSNVDAAHAGSYSVNIHAVDNHGNAADVSVPVTVKAKPVVKYHQVSVNSSENAAYIYNFLRTEAGFSKAATAGIMANIQIESSFNPTAGTSYYGLCQWGGGRASNLVAYCSSRGYSSSSVEGQIRFMLSEMSSGLISEMNACEDSEDGAAQAGYLFRTKFERSAGLNNVQAVAASFYNAY